jgi:transposase
MLSFASPVKIFLCAQPVDLRRSFDGLAAIARDGLGENPLSGDWFVFRNRRGDRLKVLMWDRDGLLLVYKRLEQGTFRFPVPAPDARSVQVTTQELSLLLWGIDPSSVIRQKRYVRPQDMTSAQPATAGSEISAR